MIFKMDLKQVFDNSIVEGIYSRKEHFLPRIE